VDGYVGADRGNGRMKEEQTTHMTFQKVRPALKTAAVMMSWLEGVVPRSCRPTSKGLVIGRMVEAAIDGTASIDYRESGFSWRLSAPLAGTLQKARLASSAVGARG
jgi:hypothetical protein